MLKLFVVSVLLGTLAGMTFAQTAEHNHNMAPPDLIDGAKNPNLIPDLTAWRLWLISVTTEDPDHPELAADRTRAFLRAAAIQESDLPAAEEALSHFRTDYATLLESHNTRLNSGENVPISEFVLQRDTLVKATQTSMLGKIGQVSAGRLKAWVIGQKKSMQIAKEVR